MKHTLCILALIFASQAIATDYQANLQIEELFKQKDVQGTFVLFEAQAETYTVHNPKRAEQRFIPASTFKIPNSLIGLSVGAVKSVDEVLPYGGEPQPYDVWEKDMGLREAITISNVPIYQELARRIGLEQMQKGVSLLGYGNSQVGETVDNFWLEGPLKTSAIEQVQFLARLAQNKLPLSENIQASVREIVKLEEGDGWVLYGKTGWLMATQPNIGWWVGWVESNGDLFCFALNIDIHTKQDAGERIELGKACLKALGKIE